MRRPLEAESPAARAIHQLWSGRRLVAIELAWPDPSDPLLVACEAVSRMLEANVRTRVIFAAAPGQESTVQARINEASYMPGSGTTLAAFSSRIDFGFDPYVQVREPVAGEQEGPTADLFVAVLRHAPEVVLDPVPYCGRARQVLVVADRGAKVDRKTIRSIISRGKNNEWGEIPLDVILAGG